MKKITAEEFDNLPKKGWGRSSNAYNAIFNLKIGEGVIIEKKEWGSRGKTPSIICRYIQRKSGKTKYVCVTLADNSGWAIKRIQ